MKAAVTLLLHVGVLLCLSWTGWADFVWDPTTQGPPQPRATLMPVPTIRELWMELIERLEMRHEAMVADIENLEARNAALQRDLFFVRTDGIEARRRMEMSFNRSLTALQSNLNRVWTWINANRESRSDFSAGLTNNVSMSCIRGPTVVNYRAVFINLGGDYDEQHGVYTVTRPGVYVMALVVYSNSGEPFALLRLCIELRVNGITVINPSENYRQDQEDSTTAVISMHLNANDTVDVYLPRGCDLCDDNSHHNTFTIFLQYPDSTGA